MTHGKFTPEQKRRWQQTYQERHRDEINARHRASYAADPTQRRAYYLSRRDELTERRRARYWADPDAARAERRSRHEAKHEETNARRRMQYAAHREAERAKRLAYEADADVRERRRELDRIRHQRDLEKRRTLARVMKARRKGALGVFTHDQWQTIVNAFERRCAYCGVAGEPLTADHVVPIARGGRNDIENVLPACMTCNRAKGVRDAAEFAAHRLAAIEAERLSLEQQIRALRESAPGYFGVSEQLALIR